MVSVVFIILGCCIVSVPVSEAWWWQLPMLDRLRQGQPLIPWEDPGDLPVASPDHADELKFLLMGLPKRGLTLLSSRDDDPMSRIIKGRLSKLRKMTTVGRPRGHPLRWG